MTNLEAVRKLEGLRNLLDKIAKLDSRIVAKIPKADCAELVTALDMGIELLEYLTAQ
jgi:hypothetical protein